jgi:hypothetical protein
MTFGKYKWRDIRKVPRDYLQWLVKNGKLRPPLLDHINAVLTRTPIPDEPKPKPETILDLIEKVRKIFEKKRKQQ